MFRPDLVDVWVFRRPVDRDMEILLLRRSAGRLLAGLWQGVSGSLEPDERIASGALRELEEETGFGASAIEAFYDLDQVNLFHEPSFDAIVSAAEFAVQVRPGAEPMLSAEHDGLRWLTSTEALELLIWPAYRESIARIESDLLDPTREPWFRLDLDGSRGAR